MKQGLSLKDGTKTESSASGRPYLDKLCASPHIPNLYNKHEINSISVIPRLDHTGITSEFQPKKIHVTDSQGRLTESYKRFSRTKLLPIYRDQFELTSRETVFRQGHKQFMDLILQDMEDLKRTKQKRRMRHWSSSKLQLGFSNNFNQLTELDDKISPKNETSEYPFEFDTEDTEPHNNQRLDQGVHSHEHVKFADPSRPESRVASPHAGGRSSPAPLNRTLTASSTYSAMSNGSSTSSHRMRPHSRMSLFKELLETVEPPRSPNKRYGSLGDLKDHFHS